MLKARPGHVLVVNVFTRTAAWRFPDAAQHIEQIQAIRHKEESLMTRLTGARIHALDLPEALLRGHSQDEAFTAEAGPAESGIADSVMAAVSNLARQHAQARWRLPLGVGNHIDHRIVRDSALTGLRNAGVDERRVSFYEDLPYAALLSEVPDFSRFFSMRTLEENGCPINKFRKSELLRLYWSQLSWNQIVGVRDYAGRVGRVITAERCWHFAKA